MRASSLAAGVRLDDVVVGAAVEQADDLGLVVAVATITGTADTPRSMRSTSAPVDVGQPQVEDDHVGDPVDGRGQRRRARRLGAHHVARPHQGVGDRLADAQVVLDDQHGGHARHRTPGASRSGDRRRLSRALGCASAGARAGMSRWWACVASSASASPGWWRRRRPA